MAGTAGMAGMDSDGEPRPAGFPACGRCAYRVCERPLVCVECLASVTQPGADPTASCCPVCEQTLRADGSCANDWCGRADRWFSLVFSIGPRSGSLRRAISRYKYRGEVEWADVFGRLLLGFLDDRMPSLDEYDFLLSMPCYRGPAARRSWDPVLHISAVAERLAGPRWPFLHGVIEKRQETPCMAGQTLGGRRAVAEGSLRRALRVVAPRQVAGARILVVDDVFTEGSTLREVARALLMAGANEVAGLVLARQPWTPRGG